MEAHGKNPVCASCHKIIDTIGFSLENSDLTGKWRLTDPGIPIDSSSQMVDGTSRDVNVFQISAFGIGLLLSCIAVVFAMWAMFDFLAHREDANSRLLPFCLAWF
jgi:hypothetical protein